MADFELNWKSKKLDIDKVILPFQKIEEIDISRTGRSTLLAYGEKNKTEWRNKLIWGDNKYIISSLLKDPSVAGKIKLIYIDPPFFTGTNMNINIKIGEQNEVTKEPSAIEEVAYRNMWKEGPSSFLQYMYERLKLMRDLLAENGSIYVRFDYHYSHYIKVILDEIFGYDNFRNEIIINRTKKVFEGTNRFTTATDSLFFYTKSSNYKFNGYKKDRTEQKWIQMHSPGIRWSPISEEDSKKFNKKNIKEENSKFSTQARIILGKELLPPSGRHWTFIQERLELYQKEGRIRFNPKTNSPEYLTSSLEIVDSNWTDVPGYSFSTGYPTENAEHVLERVIKASSNEGDLVVDFFAGSGTTGAVAEKLGRKWLMCDIGRFSIHTIRKRLLDIPTCKPFEVLNMGKYERKYWAETENLENYRNYVNFIVKLYSATPLENFVYAHGKKGSKAIHVGLVDSPVTKQEIIDTLEECNKAGFNSLDILGWEYEMATNDTMIKEAKDLYAINLGLYLIPREVMDKRAVDSGDIDFYELAHLQTEVVKKEDKVKVKLTDFIIPNAELIPEDVKKKIKKWTDYIDYWAVDWDYKNVFHNDWQTYRTKTELKLKTETADHTYKKGAYKILIKVIDIFGNDTSTIKEVVIK